MYVTILYRKSLFVFFISLKYGIKNKTAIAVFEKEKTQVNILLIESLK
jgi:hypothetical protein